MLSQKRAAILEAKFISPKITDETIADMRRSPRLYRGHVKTSRGEVYVAGEFERRSNEVLSIKLP